MDNAILYNKPGTHFHKVAARIKEVVKTELDLLNDLSLDTSRLRQEQVKESVSNEQGVVESSDAISRMHVGDLEPPIELLELLLSQDIKDELKIVLDDDPLTSLFNYELAKLKPPLKPLPLPTPRTRAPGKHLAKPKRDRRAEYDRRNEKRRRQKEEAAAAAAFQDEVQVVAGTGGVAGRTRRAMAAAAASEAAVESQKRLKMKSRLRQPKESTSQAVGEATSAEMLEQRPPGKRATPKRISEAPPMVRDVGRQESFTMFNQGWIFPEEQKRGGRTPVERQVVGPRPSKRLRTGMFIRL